MKVVLLALNSKYIHTSLALRSIQAYCKDYSDYIDLIETTINNNENHIIKTVYSAAPDILGISCYIWNMNYVKTLVPTLKKLLPHTTIILGGPEVSYDAQEVLSIEGVDIIMQGEGEQTWKDYLDFRFHSKGDLSTIDGLAYKNITQTIEKTSPRQPLDLKLLPFVYKNMDELSHKILYYEASRGCPFQCQYCLSSIEQGVRFAPIEQVKSHLDFFLAQQVKQVKFVDRTFNARHTFAMDIWEHIIKHDNGITNFHFEIAAELIREDMYLLLANARPGLIQFEIGVQSTNPEVLKLIHRPMPFKEIRKVVLKLKSLQVVHQHLDLIAGLPTEDYTSFRHSFNEVMDVRPEQFQLGFLKLLKGSGLRQRADDYGIVYKQEPPYEVLYTNDLSYSEMIRLHGIDEMVDKYYNTGRFKYSLEYLFNICHSPFDCFEKLSIFWEEHGYDNIGHQKQAYYQHLFEFSTCLSDINVEKLKELMSIDYILAEKTQELPLFLERNQFDLNQLTLKELLKDDLFVQNHLPNLAKLPLRQQLRKVALKSFKFIHLPHHIQELFVLEEQNEKFNTILFDFSTSPTQLILLEEESDIK